MREATKKVFDEIILELYEQRLTGYEKEKFISDGLRYLREYSINHGEMPDQIINQYWAAVRVYNSWINRRREKRKI